MNQISSIESVLQIENLYFSFIHFEATGMKAAPQGKIQNGFKLDKSFNGNTMELVLNCRVSIQDCMDLTMTLVGNFNLKGDGDITKFVPNAVAIMFPYIRSQISLQTAQPNLPNLVLPPININRLLADQEAKHNK